MKIRGIPLHDMHLHIRQGCTVEEYLEKANHLGIEVMGITEHLWDLETVPVPDAPEYAFGLNYYREKTLSKIHTAKAMFTGETGDVALFWGCETEFSGPLGLVGISAERAKTLDYVVTPHSHFYLPGFTWPAEMTEPKALAGYMVDTFCQVALSPMTDVIAHPFDPTGAAFQAPDDLREIFSHLPRTQLEYCFGMAAKQGKIIEVNLGSFVHGLRNDLYKETYIPMFAAAKEAGCKFCLASDAQKPDDLQRIAPENAEYIIDAIGLTVEDIALPVNRI